MNESNLGTLFFINKSSKVDEVDFAILLKNDRIIFLVTKFIANTITLIDLNLTEKGYLCYNFH